MRTRLAGLSRLCLFMLLAGLPLAFWASTDDHSNTAQFAYLWTVAAAGLAALLLAEGMEGVRLGGVGPPLAGWVAVSVAAVPAAFRTGFAVYDLLGVLAGGAVAVLGARWLRDRGGRRAAGTLLIAATLAVTGYALLQYAGIDYVRWALDYGGRRPVATMGNPNFLAGHLVTILPLAVVLLLGERGTFAKTACGAAFAASAATIFVSQTRGAWIAAVVSLAVTGWILRRHVPALLAANARWLMALAAVAALAGVVEIARNPAMRERVATLAHPDVSAHARRLSYWHACLRLWREHPVAGLGAGSFRHGYALELAAVLPKADQAEFVHSYSEVHAHNDWLEMLAERGILGAGLFIWVVAAAVRCALRGLRRGAAEARLAAGLCGGFVALGVHALFNLPLHVAPTLALLWAGVGQAVALDAPSSGRARPVGWIGSAAAVAAVAIGVLAALQMRTSCWSRIGMEGMRRTNWSLVGYAYEQADKTDWIDRREAFYMASARAQLGDLAEAERLYLVEIARNPYFMDGWANLGAVYGRAGRVDDAIRTSRRAIELNPAYAEAYVNCGIALMSRGKRWEAVAEFTRALALDPGNATARAALAQIGKR